MSRVVAGSLAPLLERLRFLTSHPNWMTDDLLDAGEELVAAQRSGMLLRRSHPLSAAAWELALRLALGLRLAAVGRLPRRLAGERALGLLLVHGRRRRLDLQAIVVEALHDLRSGHVVLLG